MINIILLKQQVWELEKVGKRVPIYILLREKWSKETDRSQLALLVIQQMVYFLDDLEGPPIPIEQEDEYELYHSFLQEALQYGMKHCLHDKMFLWQMCYYLEGDATYHFLYGETIPVKSVDAIKEELFALARRYFPESKLFALIPAIVHIDYLYLQSIGKHDRLMIAEELSQWNLQSNAVDDDLKELFEDIVSDHSSQT